MRCYYIAPTVCSSTVMTFSTECGKPCPDGAITGATAPCGFWNIQRYSACANIIVSCSKVSVAGQAAANEDTAAALSSSNDELQKLSNSNYALNFGVTGGVVGCVVVVVAVVVIRRRRALKRPAGRMSTADKTKTWVGTEAPQITVK